MNFLFSKKNERKNAKEILQEIYTKHIFYAEQIVKWQVFNTELAVSKIKDADFGLFVAIDSL